ncbi:hypothetical protein GCM10010211_38070 [Streptomyces albospinus]|uniref:MFS transporter n=1 Tax=Streptomyces albospinus TaxID=285515 RepID=A0ABQ2V7R3_9ACTN|nr:hypothetical protein GCM10010211_38070 [Streptomyces albospinus]
MADNGAPDVIPRPHPVLRRARRSVAAVFLVHGAATGNFATRIPWIQDHTGISPGQLGLALAFPAIGASLAMPLAGRISHRFGARTALRGLLACWTLSLLLPALSPDVHVLCLALLAYGASSGMADVARHRRGPGRRLHHRLRLHDGRRPAGRRHGGGAVRAGAVGASPRRPR